MKATPGSSAWRKAHWPACEKADLVRAKLGPQGIVLAVARDTQEAFEALFDTFAAHGYVIRPKVTGSYNCRKITGGKVPSAHASGIAVDVNWDTNPYTPGKLVTDMPNEMVIACSGIRTRAGVPVWRWGGDWDGRPDTPHAFYDAMHWEIIATRAELRAGIDRVVTLQSPAAMPVLRKGHNGPAVVKLQGHLTIAGFPVPTSGQFLQQTDRAVRAFQASRGLKVDGRVGPATWTALLNDLPAVPKGGVTPSKARAA